MYTKINGELTQAVGVMGTNYEVINATNGWQEVNGLWESEWLEAKNFNRLGVMVSSKDGVPKNFTVGYLWAEDKKGEVVGFDWVGNGDNATAVCGSKDVLGSLFKIQIVCDEGTFHAYARLFNY